MSSVVIAGNTSGTVTLNAPDIAGTTVLTLPTTSGTIVTTAGGSTVPFALGSAAAPSITFTGDTNTGIFSPGADTIGFAEGGAEVMRITSAGFVGIGETNPNTILHANGDIRSTNASSNFSRFSFGQYGSSGTSYSFIQGDARDTGYMAFYTNVTERMRIDSSGRVLVGQTSSNGTSSIAGVQSRSGFSCTTTNGEVSGLFVTSSNADNSLFIGADQDNLRASSYIAFGVDATERMRLQSNGTLSVGTSSSSVGSNSGVVIEGGGTIALSRGVTTLANVMEFNNPNGGVGTIRTENSSTSYNTSSDYRLKENIAPMTGALDKVALLKPCTYTWKVDGKEGQGFIAHELAEVVPDCVSGEKDATKMEQYEISPAVPATYDEEGNELTPAVEAVMGEREVPVYQGIDTSFLVATLTAAIQEQQAIINEQASTIAAFEARLVALENK